MNPIDISPVSYSCFVHPVPAGCSLVDYRKDHTVDKEHPWYNYARISGYDYDGIFYLTDVIKDVDMDKPKEQGYYLRITDALTHYSTLGDKVKMIQLSVIDNEDDLVNAIRQYASIGHDKVRVVSLSSISDSTQKEISIKETIKLKYTGTKDSKGKYIYNNKGMGVALDTPPIDEYSTFNCYGDIGGVPVVIA